MVVRFLLYHLKEEKIGQLLDVIAVVDPIMSQGVTETPKLTYDVSHEFISPSPTPSPARGEGIIQVLSPFGRRQGPKILAGYETRKLPHAV